MPAHLAKLLWMQRGVADHIQTVPAEQGDSQRKLWGFVSSFTENKVDGDKLSKLYAKLSANKSAPSGKLYHLVPHHHEDLHGFAWPQLVAPHCLDNVCVTMFA